MFMGLKILGRKCPCCENQISLRNRVVAVYDFSVKCDRCNNHMELKKIIIVVNMALSNFSAALLMHASGAPVNFYFFISMSILALFVILPLITIICFSFKISDINWY